MVRGQYRLFFPQLKRLAVIDPMVCRYYGNELELWKIWHPKYRTIYYEYENIKSGKYGLKEKDINTRVPVLPSFQGTQLPLFPVQA